MTEKSLFGRTEQLATIADSLVRAANGQPTVVLVTGEAGGGKTSLLRSALDLRPPGEWLVAEGYALPGVGIPPYYAVGRALRRLLREIPAELLTDVAPALAAAKLVDGPGAAADSGGSQLAVLEAFARVIDQASAGRPVLLSLDDMQWAGPGDWDVLTHIVRAVDASLAVIVACRDEAFLDASGAAARAHVELNRQRVLMEVRAGPLPGAAIHALCEQALKGPVSERLANAVAARSDGNPFLVEELTIHLSRADLLTRDGDLWDLPHAREAATSLPGSIALGTATELESLGQPAREILHHAAVLGRSFDAGLLPGDRVSADDVDAGLREALSHGFVGRMEGSQWSFRHDLVREAVLATISATQRAALHRKAALAIESRPGSAGDMARLSALAYHWRAAGEHAAATRAALDASVGATNAFAPAEALHFAELATESATELPGDPGIAIRTMVRLGDTQVEAGLYAEAEATFSRLLEAAHRRDDNGLIGQTWLRLGIVARRREQPDVAVKALLRALEALEPLPGQASSIARVLIELASVAALTTAAYSSAEVYANRALALARDLGDRGLEAEALVALGSSITRAEGPRASRMLLEEALIRAESSGRLSLACDTAAGLSNNYYWSGELRKAETFGKKRLELATRAHDIFGLRHGHSWLALLAASRGEWSTARGLLTEAEPMLSHLASPEPVGFIRVISAFVHHRTGNDHAAAADITEAMGMLEPLGAGTMLWYGSLAAMIYLQSGWTEGALRQVQAQEERLREVPGTALPARSARAALGLVYAALGDRDRTAACAAELREFPDDYHWSPVRRTLAAAVSLEGDVETAIRLLGEAELRAREEGTRPDLGLILLDRARLVPHADRSRASELAEAIEVFEELGMTRELQAAIELTGRTRNTAQHPAGLSAREVEVLQLLAAGMTNRQIASHLVLSERTVANHVTNIYTKIDVENRAGATAFAARHGLLNPG